jgi:hypothetical protein
MENESTCGDIIRLKSVGPTNKCGTLWMSARLTMKEQSCYQ